jgi:hypothetical protein
MANSAGASEKKLSFVHRRLESAQKQHLAAIDQLVKVREVERATKKQKSDGSKWKSSRERVFAAGSLPHDQAPSSSKIAGQINRAERIEHRKSQNRIPLLGCRKTNSHSEHLPKRSHEISVGNRLRGSG